MAIVAFFFNDTATTEIYTLSLHDALPISARGAAQGAAGTTVGTGPLARADRRDRKSTRLNSSHSSNSYAVFCLKKKRGYNSRLLAAGLPGTICCRALGKFRCDCSSVQPVI